MVGIKKSKSRTDLVSHSNACGLLANSHGRIYSTYNPPNPIAYSPTKPQTYRPQHLQLITSMDPMNPVDQDSPPVISATSLDLYLNDVHPTQMPGRQRQEEQEGDFDRVPRPSLSTDLEVDLGIDADVGETLDRSHDYDLNEHYDLDNHYDLDDHHDHPTYYEPNNDHYDDDTHAYNHDQTHTYTHEHEHKHNHGLTNSSPILLPTPSPTLSEHTRRWLSYGDPLPDPYSFFGLVDRILTPKTPDRLVMPGVDGEGEVLVLDRAFNESDSSSFISPRRTRIKETERLERMGMESEMDMEIERRDRRDTPRSPGKPQAVTPEPRTSTSSTIRTGENGILLTPGDKEGMTGLGIVCRPRSGSGYSTPTPASISTPEAGMGAGIGSEPGSVMGSAGSVARRRVLTFSREEQEDDTYNNLEPDNLVLRSSFQSRSPQHERYRITSSAYALPAPVNRNRKKHNHGGNGRAYRQRKGKYPFNNPFARILFFSTVVILLAALFGVGGFVDDGADAGGTEYELRAESGMSMGMRGNGNEYKFRDGLVGWSGMVGDETQVFGLVGIPATPSGGMSGNDFYGEQPVQGHYQTSHSYLDGIDEDEEKSKGYKLHKRRVHQQKYKRNGWRAKVRRAGAALHSHAEE